ncbi:MAG: hypothetical protein ACI83P_001003 [Janthinobacterium sp.]|jgi:hypothetical protein
MNKTTLTLVLVLLVGAATGVYFWQQSSPPAAPPQEPAKVELAVTAPATAATPITPAPGAAPASNHYPVPAGADTKALPALNASDPALWDALSTLLGRAQVLQFFRAQEIVRNIVVTIDNLPRQTAAAKLLPLKPVAGTLRTEEIAGKRTIAPANATRYDQYVLFADQLDARAVVKLYIEHYPLFQRAYQDLGYPDAYFNDRLIAVIDHLLQAPASDAPAALIQPHIVYKFADPRLEARSSGHKMLLRMGNAHANRIKSKLREIRAALIEQAPQQAL